MVDSLRIVDCRGSISYIYRIERNAKFGEDIIYILVQIYVRILGVIVPMDAPGLARMPREAQRSFKNVLLLS